eukprot:SAG11_NODE_1294_length_5278_cov_2.485229_2_plen_509_part_00
MQLAQGKISVRCPFDGCGRALQTRELQDHVSNRMYQKLLESLREAEEAHDAVDIAAALGGLPGEVRRCPRCRVPIEKNRGCGSMRCYRCGHDFSWHDAQVLGGQAQEHGADTASAERRRRRLPQGGWIHIMDWDPAGLRGHRLVGAPLAVARQVASVRELLGQHQLTPSRHAAVLVAAIGAVLVHHTAGLAMLTLLLVGSGTVAAISLIPTAQLHAQLHASAWERGILAVSKFSATGLRKGVCLCGVTLVTHYTITPLVSWMFSAVFYMLYKLASLVLYGLCIALFWLLPLACWHWRWTIILIEGIVCTFIVSVGFWCWPVEFALSWGKLVGPADWKVLTLISQSLRDGTFVGGVVSSLFFLFPALKLTALWESTYERCYSMSASTSGWLTSANCTATILLANDCGFTCVGDNCAVSTASFNAWNDGIFSRLFHVQPNCSWTWDTDFWDCSSLAPLGFGLDPHTGTCAPDRAELEASNWAFFPAWVFLPTWLFAVFGRTAYLVRNRRR